MNLLVEEDEASRESWAIWIKRIEDLRIPWLPRIKSIVSFFLKFLRYKGDHLGSILGWWIFRHPHSDVRLWRFSERYLPWDKPHILVGICCTTMFWANLSRILKIRAHALLGNNRDWQNYWLEMKSSDWRRWVTQWRTWNISMQTWDLAFVKYSDGDSYKSVVNALTIRVCCNIVILHEAVSIF